VIVLDVIEDPVTSDIVVCHISSRNPRGLPPIVCSRCNGPIVPGQQVAPLFSAKLVRWSEHPVLSKPPMIRGIIPPMVRRGGWTCPSVIN
jgi:hypothetical protein